MWSDSKHPSPEAGSKPVMISCDLGAMGTGGDNGAGSCSLPRTEELILMYGDASAQQMAPGKPGQDGYIRCMHKSKKSGILGA